ncbi:hypothetical protein K1T71_000856 [Dendrolimus kikuchii]|uniref:Uncharacterized protein n=1 Tax=Dendrolimus kikuchii TaxID=765133 RepID=A0ACC1DG46_9NEOP|nr:hypothetical protein K1T71_000856 [Dendrolimus kikuchii]
MEEYERIFCILVTFVLSSLKNTNAEYNPMVVQYSSNLYINMIVVLEHLPRDAKNAVLFYRAGNDMRNRNLDDNKEQDGTITLKTMKSFSDITDNNSAGESLQLFTHVYFLKNYTPCGGEALIASFVHNRTSEGSDNKCKHNCIDVDKGCIIHMSWGFKCENVEYLNYSSNYLNCLDTLESGTHLIKESNWPLFIGVPAAIIVVLFVLIWCIIKLARKVCKAKRGNNNTLDVAVYSTANEVQYAEIVPLAKRSNNIRGLDNLTPYAEIIGVLEPK